MISRWFSHTSVSAFEKVSPQWLQISLVSFRLDLRENRNQTTALLIIEGTMPNGASTSTAHGGSHACGG